MTLELTKKYRRLQTGGIVMSTILFFIATITYAMLGSWSAWAILSIVGMSILIVSHRASKMEVLSALDIDLQTYEQIKTRQERRGK